MAHKRGLLRRILDAIKDDAPPGLSSAAARKMGSAKSEAKAKASRENGKKGGRPRKTTQD